MTTSTQPVLCTVASRLAHLELNGEAGNAFNLALTTALAEAAGELSRATASGEVGALLITAAGANFCVGGDLREFAAQGDRISTHIDQVAGRAHEAIAMLGGLAIPVVCAVQGATAGGGLGLVAVSDVVVAARSAKFRVAYTAIGLSPDCGTSWYLPRIVGPRRALDLALTNPAIGAEEALRLGLVTRVADDGESQDVARDIATKLAAGPTDAFIATKALMRASATADLADQLDAEAASISSLAGKEYGRAAIAAFVARSRP